MGSGTSLGGSLLPLGLAIAGLVCLAGALVFHLRVRQLKKKSEIARDSWLRVPAKILYSRVEESMGRRMMCYSARFKYEYCVGGMLYVGTQYSLIGDWSSSDREPHDREVAGFPEGREVNVWVNPEDPSECVLKVDPSAFPDSTLTLIPFFAVLFGLGLLGAALVVGFVRS